MLRSFDHLGRHVDRDVRPGTPPPIEDWIVRARAAFLEAYGDHDPVLLRALEFEKETYEYVYARHVPARVDARRRPAGCAGCWGSAA